MTVTCRPETPLLTTICKRDETAGQSRDLPAPVPSLLRGVRCRVSLPLVEETDSPSGTLVSGRFRCPQDPSTTTPTTNSAGTACSKPKALSVTSLRLRLKQRSPAQTWCMATSWEPAAMTALSLGVRIIPTASMDLKMRGATLLRSPGRSHRETVGSTT
mmetsp:Transcript_28006/g.56748  ORF Transcript_28006/g.56748 Transcript_28006/m.56748 type:complete len:159 (-) Transcript_28006:77-553(-)